MILTWTNKIVRKTMVKIMFIDFNGVFFLLGFSMFIIWSYIGPCPRSSKKISKIVDPVARISILILSVTFYRCTSIVKLYPVLNLSSHLETKRVNDSSTWFRRFMWKILQYRKTKVKNICPKKTTAEKYWNQIIAKATSEVIFQYFKCDNVDPINAQRAAKM